MELTWTKAAETALRRVAKRNGWNDEQTAVYREVVEAKCEYDEAHGMGSGRGRIDTFVVWMLAPDGVLMAAAHGLAEGARMRAEGR